ncbi:deflated [Carabus blaptoides fortunei]
MRILRSPNWIKDYDRIKSNFLRLCVLRVCQQSEKHLDKISNVDEFVRRVFSVIHSNDPIARALTLRTLGAVAGMIPERHQVHHSIRRSLDSHDAVEVEAAIYAAMQFASQSKTFAVSMCNKISDMIQGQVTPAPMKLQLIPILQYMHHDTSTAALVRQLCMDLLPTYPAQDFVLVTLKTLTQLAAATLVDIPSQVALLLKYLRCDPRWEVKAQTLKSLHQLASQGGHLWPAGAVEAIVDVASNTETQKVLSLSLGVIQVLTESPVTCHSQQEPQSSVRKLCIRSCYSPNLVIAAQAIQVLTRILCYCYKENLPVHDANKVVSALEALILQLVHCDNTRHVYQLKLCLRCAVSLCEAHSAHCTVFVEQLEFHLVNGDGLFNTTLCEALGAISSVQPQTLIPFFPDFLRKLKDLSALASPSASDIQTKVMMCTVMFQTLSIYEWTPEIANAIYTVILRNNLWANYRIARSAARYGHHKISYSIFSGLTEQVSSEHLHFWLVSLKELSEAEAQLLNIAASKNSLVQALNQAIVHYNKAVAALKAASTPTHNLQFQAEYIRLRTEYLQCLVQLVHTSDSLCTVPPPAIASTIVQASRDELQRYGYVTNQLRKCTKDLKSCGELYWKLYQSVFDADPATLENIQILQQMCSLLEQSVDRICVAGSSIRNIPVEFGTFGVRLESQQLIRSCQNATLIAQSMTEDARQSGITHKDMECLLKQVEVLARASLCVPRYFFQVLQSTSVKLAISPQPRVAGEFISVQPGSQLAVKVEGVIQHGKRPGLFRTVNGIIITVTSQLQPTAKSNIDVKQPKDNCSVLTQTVNPHRDFFTAQFLLAFPQGGQYALAVEAALVDERDNTWRTGPKSTLTVKVPEETEKKSSTTPPVATASSI